jgi:serine/threonine protein kinase
MVSIGDKFQWDVVLTTQHLPANVVNKQTRPSCTPAAFCAPELIFQRVVLSVDPSPTQASDIWSLACTVRGLAWISFVYNP